MVWPFRRKSKPSSPPERQHSEPPTEKQLRYAKHLGIAVPKGMSKEQLSAAITDSKQNVGKSQTPRRNKRRSPRSTDQIEQERQLEKLADEWIEFAANVEYMLAIYNRRKEIVVDVLRVDDSDVSYDRTHGLLLELSVAAPKRVKDRDLGDYLEWENEFALPIASLLYHEPLGPDFADKGIAAYTSTVRKGLEIAARISPNETRQ